MVKAPRVEVTFSLDSDQAECFLALYTMWEGTRATGDPYEHFPNMHSFEFLVERMSEWAGEMLDNTLLADHVHKPYSYLVALAKIVNLDAGLPDRDLD